MDRQELLARFDKEQRIAIEFPDMEKQTLPHLVRFVRPSPGMNFVLYSDLRDADPGPAIQGEIAYFEERGQRFEWKVYEHDQPPDLRDRLAAAGFEVEEAEAVMILDLETAPASLLSPVRPADRAITIRPITTREGLADVIQVEEQVWEEKFDWISDRLGAHLEVPGYLNVYVADVDREPAAAGWIYFHPGSKQFADIWGGSTVEKFRRRGLYTALLAIRAQEARRRGYRYLTIDASPMSRPIVARHGFQLLTYAHACNWPQST